MHSDPARTCEQGSESPLQNRVYASRWTHLVFDDVPRHVVSDVAEERQVLHTLDARLLPLRDTGNTWSQGTSETRASHGDECNRERFPYILRTPAV